MPKKLFFWIVGILKDKKWIWDKVLRGFFPDSKESACSAGDPCSIPGLGRFPGEGNDNPFQYSCLDNFMDRGAWRAIVHEGRKSRIRQQLLTLSLSLVVTADIF